MTALLEDLRKSRQPAEMYFRQQELLQEQSGGELDALAKAERTDLCTRAFANSELFNTPVANRCEALCSLLNRRTAELEVLR